MKKKEIALNKEAIHDKCEQPMSYITIFCNINKI